MGLRLINEATLHVYQPPFFRFMWYKSPFSNVIRRSRSIALSGSSTDFFTVAEYGEKVVCYMDGSVSSRRVRSSFHSIDQHPWVR